MEKLNGAEDGQRVVARFTKWDKADKKPQGEIISIIKAEDESDMAMKEILIDAGFPLSFEQEVLKDPGAVLLDFYTESCSPCRAMAPVLEQICSEMTGRVKVIKVDAEACRQTARSHNIRSVPTFILYRAGKPVAQTSGLQGKKVFTGWLENALTRT